MEVFGSGNQTQFSLKIYFSFARVLSFFKVYDMICENRQSKKYDCIHRCALFFLIAENQRRLSYEKLIRAKNSQRAAFAADLLSVCSAVAFAEDVRALTTKPATCIEEGYTGDEFCSVCGERRSEGETHTAKWVRVLHYILYILLSPFRK